MKCFLKNNNSCGVLGSKRGYNLFPAPVTLFIVGLFVANLFPVLITGEYVFTHDSYIWLGFPFAFFDGLLRGSPPFWNPFLATGMPMYFMLGMHHLYDPLSLSGGVICKLFNPDIIFFFHWIFVIRILIMAYGSYFLAKKLFKYRVTWVLVFIMTLFSAQALAVFHQNGLLYNFFLCPWILYFALRFFREKTIPMALGLGFCTGWSVLNYSASYGFVFFTLMAIFSLIVHCHALRHLFQRRVLLLLALAVFVAIAIGSPLLSLYPERNSIMPVVRAREGKVVSMSLDSEYQASATSIYSTHGKLVDFLGLLAPAAALKGHLANNDSFSESFLYIGLFPLCLAFLGLIRGQSVIRFPLLGTFILLCLLFLGPLTPVHSFVFTIFPPIRFSRHMHLFGAYINFCLILFAAMGLDLLLTRLSALKNDSKKPDIIVLACAILVFICLTGLALFPMGLPLANYSLPLFLVVAIATAVVLLVKAFTGNKKIKFLFFCFASLFFLLDMVSVSNSFLSLLLQPRPEIPSSLTSKPLVFYDHRLPRMIGTLGLGRYESNILKMPTSYLDYQLPGSRVVFSHPSALFEQAMSKDGPTHLFGLDWNKLTFFEMFNTLLDQLSKPQFLLPAGWSYAEDGAGGNVNMTRSQDGFYIANMTSSSYGRSFIFVRLPLNLSAKSKPLYVSAHYKSSNEDTGNIFLSIESMENSPVNVVATPGVADGIIEASIIPRPNSKWIIVRLGVLKGYSGTASFSSVNISDSPRSTGDFSHRIPMISRANASFDSIDESNNSDIYEMIRFLLAVFIQNSKEYHDAGVEVPGEELSHIISSGFDYKDLYPLRGKINELMAVEAPLNLGMYHSEEAPCQPLAIADIFTRRPAKEFFKYLWLHDNNAALPFYVASRYWKLNFSCLPKETLDKLTGVGTSPVLRFYPLGCVRTMPEEEMMDSIAKNASDYLLLDSSMAKEDLAPTLSAGQCREQNTDFTYKVQSFDYNDLILSVRTKTQGYLSYADGFDKFWKSDVDGKRSPVVPSQLAFKAVKVDAGEHLIHFFYQPWPFIMAILLCHIVSTAIICYALFLFFFPGIKNI
ncbi:MAG: hypothetical protein HQK81_11665 [Desulfovibrionaceae bacterium]|nr:hypothetical protein [Desulfovibrionaceae bacterium]MBF0514699.1 hypothetical protein [Desulfovibrionaceae bacterium]